MIRLWHRLVLKHHQTVKHVSVPLFDIGAKGLLIDCECGKTWAL